MVDKALFDFIFIGSNPWGDVVMYCRVCEDTFAKQVQNKNLNELLGAAG